ncbi:MAG: PD-(D/E)XK nuclease family protein, partial [bacterium]
KLASTGHSVKLELARPLASLFGESRRRLLDVLSRSKYDVLVSHSVKTSEGQSVAESPFFHSLAQIALGKGKSSKVPIELTDAIQPVSFLKTHAVPSEKPTISARHSLLPFPVPVTALAQFIRCPRQFFYEQILKLEIPERPTALLVGSLLHEAMAHFLAPGVAASRPNMDRIRSWIRDHFRSCDELISLPDGIRFSLERFVGSALDKFFEQDVWQGTVESVEQSFELMVPGGFPLKGRVDRIDLTTDGLEVIDYKSQMSFGPSKLRSELLAAEDWIQLPVYVKAAEVFHKLPVSKVSIIFFGIKAKDEPKRSTIRISEKEGSQPDEKKSRTLIESGEFDQVWMRITETVEAIFRENQLFGRGEKPPCERFLHGCPFLLICPVARPSNEETPENSA